MSKTLKESLKRELRCYFQDAYTSKNDIKNWEAGASAGIGVFLEYALEQSFARISGPGGNLVDVNKLKSFAATLTEKK